MKKVCSLMAGAMIFALVLGVSSCTPKSKNNSEASVKTSVVNPQLQDRATDDPLTLLKKGNRRFVLNTPLYANKDSVRVRELVQGQYPKAIIIGCSDSRVPPEVIFDQGLGDLFVIRTAGNVMGDYELGSVEYAADHLHTKLVVVLGHSSCGAINAMLEHNCGDGHAHPVPGHIAAIVKTLGEGAEVKEVLASKGDGMDIRAVEANVVNGVKQLRNCAPILNELHQSGELKIVGAIYYIETGEVKYLDI